MKKANIKINKGKDKNSRKGKIVIKEEFSINNIAEIQKKFAEALQNFDTIDIQVTEVENFDLAAVQLLYSTHLSALKNKKKISINLDLPEELGGVLKNAGFKIEGGKFREIDLLN